MAFRDSFDQCPRCGVNLEDAAAARGCRSCGGMFVEQPVLSEMLLQMLPPPPRAWGRLSLSEVKRDGKQLACPSCDDGMKPTVINDVELDHCPKHGVWFDPDELRVTLYRVADPRNPPPFVEWEPSMELPREMRASPRVAAPPPVDRKPTKPRVTFEIREPDMPPRTLVVFEDVIKIGKLEKSHVTLGQDPHVSRLHAVIEVNADVIYVIDLGSAKGTFVNDEKITKAAVQPGDFIRCANTTLLFVSVER